MRNEALSRVVGKKIAQLRKAQGMSQDDLAEASGKMINTISNIERGLGDPRVSTLEAISKALNINMPDLFADGGQAAPKTNTFKAIMDILEQEDERFLKVALKQIKVLQDMK